MDKQKAVVCGCCRSIEKNARLVLSDMHRIGKLFSSYIIIIYENDSIDRTLAILKSDKSKNVIVITEQNVPGNRATRLAHGRNAILKTVMKQYSHFDWMIVMDMDYTESIPIKGIKKAIDSHKTIKWSGCTATSSKYYDYWALRYASVGLTSDCWQHNKILFIPWDLWQPTQEITKVGSAFNGLAIYVIQDIIKKECVYKGNTCEHVAFNECLGNIIIHRNLISTCWNETAFARRIIALRLLLFPVIIAILWISVSNRFRT